MYLSGLFISIFLSRAVGKRVLVHSNRSARNISNITKGQQSLLSQSVIENQKSVAILTTEPSLCSKTLFTNSVTSAISVLLVACVGLRTTALICLIWNLCLIGFYLLSGLLQTWLKGVALSTECHLLCLWLCISTSFWAAIAIVNQSEVFGLLFSDAEVLTLIEKRWQRLERTLNGPAKAMYKSAAFRSRCEAAVRDVDLDGNGMLDCNEFRLAVARVLFDPDWGRNDPMLIVLLHCHYKLQVPLGQGVRICIAVCGLEMETTRYRRKMPYKLQLLGLTQHLSQKPNPEDVDAAFNKKIAEFDPPERLNISRERVVEDLDVIKKAYKDVTGYLEGSAASCSNEKSLGPNHMQCLFGSLF